MPLPSTFFITVGAWMYFDEGQDQKEILKRYQRKMKRYLNSIIPTTFKGFNYHHSFFDLDLNDNLVNGISNSGFFEIEATITLRKPITNFKSNNELKNAVEYYCFKVIEYLATFPISFEKNRIKKTLLNS